jgi:hypothetical protein
MEQMRLISLELSKSFVLIDSLGETKLRFLPFLQIHKSTNPPPHFSLARTARTEATSLEYKHNVFRKP